MLRSRLRSAIVILVAAGAPGVAHGQVAVSGLIFGSYNYQLRTTPAQLPSQIDNGFLVDRAYLNFRAPAGDRVSIRVTTDVYQTTEAPANAYTIRAKYAYLQYDTPRSSNGSQLMGRIGILQTVAIEHIETFWPRYLSQSAIERAGYFSSADVGVAAQYSLPRQYGEVYAIVVNGPGYQSRERDRFKDFAVRLSLTPFASARDTTLLQTLTLTGWVYKGATASTLVSGGQVGHAQDRSRAGVFAGIKDPRLVLGAEYAQRHDVSDAGSTVVVRTPAQTTGRLLSALTVVRPLAFQEETRRSPFGLVARYDHVRPTSSHEGLVPAPSPGNSYHTLIAGVFYDLSQKATLALDYQESLNSATGTTPSPLTQSKVYYLHFRAEF